MTTAAVPLGACWTKSPIDREDWPRSARRDWDWLKHPRRQRNREHTPTNREVANELGCSRRTVQRGWAALEAAGAIIRDFAEGLRKIIVRPLAGEGKEEGAEKAAAPSKPMAPRATKPPAQPAPPPPEPGPPPTPEEQRQASAALKAEVARINAQAEAQKRAGQAAASSSGPAVSIASKSIRGIAPDDDPAYLEFKERMGEILSPSERATLDAIRKNRSP